MTDVLKEEHKTIAKGTFWSLTGSVATKFISFIYLIIVARMLTQEDIGTFYLALSIVSTVSILSDLGFSSAFIRYVPYFSGKKEDEKVFFLLGGGYLLSGTLSIIFAIILFFGAGFFGAILKNSELEKPIQFLAFYLVIGTFFGLNNLFMQGRKKIKESNIVVNFQNTLKLIITVILFFFFERSLTSLSLAFVASVLIALILSFWYVRKDLSQIHISTILKKYKELRDLYFEVISFGLSISLITALYAIIGNTDKILLSYMLPEAESATVIGVYTIAISFAGLVALFPTAIGVIFFPVISELYGKNDRKKMAEVSQTAMRWVLFLLTPFTLIFIVFPDNLLQIFYGTAYVSGATVLAIFALGTFLRFLAYVHGYLLAAARFIKIELIVALFAALINIVLNIILIPIYGINGAAIASAISFSVVAILLIYYVKKIFNFVFPSDFYKPLIAGILALAFIFLVKGYVLDVISKVSDFSLVKEEVTNLIINKLIKLAILGILFGFTCLVYVFSLILIKAFAKEDISLLSTAMRKARVPNGFISFTERITSS